MPIFSKISLLRSRILPQFSHRCLNSLTIRKIKSLSETTEYDSYVYPPAELSADQAAGIVASKHSNLSTVVVESGGPMFGVELLCGTRGALFRPMVGDNVLLDNVNWAERRGRIVWVFGRKSEISVAPVANVDHLLLFFSIDKPAFEPYSLTKHLLDMETTRMPFTLALNKMDLVDEHTVNMWKSKINEWGYDPIFCSVAQNRGLDTLSSILKDKTTVIVGPSGCGKSSLVNALRTDIRQIGESKTSLIVPSIWLNALTQNNKWFKEQRVGELSAKTGQGKHTTTNVSLLPLPGGGFVADTPGYNLPKLTQITHEDLPYFFPEIKQILKKNACLLSDCYHIGEPGCTVTGPWDRYFYYLSMLDEIVKRDGLVVDLKRYGPEHYKTLFVRGDLDWKKSSKPNKKEPSKLKNDRILAKKEKPILSIFHDVKDFYKINKKKDDSTVRTS